MGEIHVPRIGVGNQLPHGAPSVEWLSGRVNALQWRRVADTGAWLRAGALARTLLGDGLGNQAAALSQATRADSVGGPERPMPG